MGISDTLLGRKNIDGNPFIEAIEPAAALPGGEVRIVGRALKPPQLARPEVSFTGVSGSIVVSSEDFVIARVPYGAHSGQVTIQSNGQVSNPREIKIAQPLAENLHPVANPALDAEGNIYVTYSGGRGQKVPVSIYKIDTDYNVKPFLSELMNATGMAFDSEGQLYVSSRYDGTVYRVAPNGSMSTYAEGMGIATGIAFDREGSLYVGDRSGTIWRIAPDRQIFVYATLEPSVAAYHLAFAPDGLLYVSGPTTSSFDAIYSVDSHGTVNVFYRGLGRPQGLAFDAQGNLYVAASLAGKRGIIRITPDQNASLVISGHGLVGLAFTRTGGAVLVTTNAVFHLAWGVQPLSLI
ncbi:MAG TPA: gluconolaconase [Candidatus Angelobacter sp.]|nr:gluconolaconase [Candidatus Angelobacter sp.]